MYCRLSAPNLMVSTVTGKLVSISSDSFNDTDPANPLGSELLLESPAAGSLSDVAAHPLRPELLLLNAEQGQLLRWDLINKCCVLSRQLSRETKAVKMVLARDGGFVVLGCEGGQVVVLKGDSLEDVVVLKSTRQPITRWVHLRLALFVLTVPSWILEDRATQAGQQYKTG